MNPTIHTYAQRRQIKTLREMRMAKPLKLSQIVNKVIQNWVRVGIEGWTKGAEFRDKNGCDMLWDAGVPHGTCSFCNSGMVKKVTNDDRTVYVEIDTAWKLIVGDSMIPSNDKPGMSFGKNLQNWFKVRTYLRNQEKPVAVRRS